MCLVITNKSIVNTIMLDMFFDQKDVIKATIKRVKNMFKDAAEDKGGEYLP